MSGSQNITNKAPKAASIRAMTSAYGRAIPLVYGRSRVQANVIYYTDFTATENKTKTKSGGKGGGSVTQTNINYTYSVCTLLALAEGVVGSIGNVWVGKAKGNLSDFGLSWFPGSDTQTALGYISTNHPTEALNYRNTSYIGAGQLELGDDPSIPGINAEVSGRYSAVDVGASGSAEANPANVILDLITDTKSCLGLPDNTQGLDQVKLFCRANEIFVSPVYTEAKPAAELIKNLCTIANTEVYFSEGKIKFVPLSTVAITANGATFTPNLAAAYNINEDQIKDDIKVFVKSQDDCYNHVKINYQNRLKDYNDDVISAKDQAAILKFGERLLPEVSLPEINSTDVAGAVAQNILRRKAHVKKTFEFKLGWQFSRLEPTDILMVTYPKLNLDNFAVRITEIEESDDGFYVKAEELLAGVVGVSRYTTEASGGYAVNYNIAAGNVNTPFIFDVPTSLSISPEVWMAVSGVDEDNWGGCNVWVSEDNATYKRIGTISGAARHGVTTATLPSGSAIDTTNTLAVSLVSQGEQLDSGTTQAAQDLETLVLVEDELLAYRDATLTGTDAYNLQYLVRGAYGSPIKSHASGVKFARLDNMIFKYTYDPDVWLGRTMYIKFQSFNVYGSAFQDLAGLTAYTHNIANVGTQIGSIANLVLTQPFIGDYVRAKWDAVKGATNYQVEVRNLAGTTTYRTVLTYETQFEYSWQDSKADGGPYRDIRIYVKALSENGESGNYTFVNAQNPVPAALTGISITGGYGVIFFEWNPDSSPDILGYQVWMSASSGFTPGSGNLLYDGTDNKGSTRTLPIPAGGAAIAPGSTYYFRIAAYDKYGKTGLNVSSEFSATVLAIASGISAGSITATMIAAGAVDMTKLASNIRPPRVVTSLPTIDGSTYKNQDTVVLTTDGKLYRAVSGSWVASVPAADVTGTLTNSQIADLAAAKITGQLIDSQLAAISAPKITGTLTNSQIADLAATKLTGQIVGTQITDNAITSPKIAAGAVIAGKIAADAITANEIQAGAIGTTELAANSITATKLLIGDTSNMFPDPDLRDANIWQGSAFTIGGTGAAISSAYRMISASSAAAQSVDMVSSARIPVEPTKDYYFRYWAGSTGVAMTVTVYADWYTLAGDGSQTLISSSALGVYTGSSTQFFDTKAAAPSNARRLSIRIAKDATGSNSQFTFGGIVVRRATNGELIVDGAITADKVAANAIVAGKIAANAVTANEIAANAITAVKIDAGAVTTPKIATGAVTANEIAANTITAAKIAAGAIGATQIATDSITAKHLSIADYSNLFLNPNFAGGSTDGWDAGLHGAVLTSSLSAPYNTANTEYVGFRNVSSSGTQDIYGFTPVQCVAGEQYYYEAEIASNGVSASSIALQLRYYNSSLPTGTPATIANTSPPSTWTKLSGVFTIPSDYDRFKAGIRINNPTVAGTLYIKSFVLRKMASSQLLVDGAITAVKIAAATITGDKISANTITAANIAGNTITGDKVAANTITATNIDSRGLTIKDAGGATIFSAGVPLDAAYAANNIKNSSITIGSNGALSGAGGGAVTIGGLGYTGALNATKNTVTRSSSAPSSPTDGDVWVDTSGSLEVTKVRVSGAWQTGATNGATIGTNLSGQITSGNVSTFIASAAIGSAQIGSLNASVINSGSMSAAFITAGTITTDRIQVGAVTANSHFSSSSTSTVGATSTKAIELSLGSFTSTGVESNINCSCVMELGSDFASSTGLNSSTAFVTADVYLKVDGVNKVVNSITGSVVRTGSTYFAHIPFSLVHRDSYSAGSHSVSARFEAIFWAAAGGTQNQSSTTECTLRANCLVQENKV